MAGIEKNQLAQLYILRRHWLPGGDDSKDDLTAAAWLDNRYWHLMEIAVNNGICKATGA